MSKTIFITGSSTGIGRATVELFSQKGWNVAATMRTPEKEQALSELPGVKLYRMDVTDTQSVEAARDKAIQDFGQIDVVVNNAGYAVSGYFENMTEEQIRRQYDVNVFGLMHVTKAFLPHFRANAGGTFVNISSIGGIVGVPGLYVYNSTKFAVEGFSEGISHELKQLGIRIKIIEPGNIGTDFYGRSMEQVPNVIADYDKVTEKQMQTQARQDRKPQTTRLQPSVIAELIYEAVNDTSDRMRYLSQDVVGMAESRQQIGADAFAVNMRKMFYGE